MTFGGIAGVASAAAFTIAAIAASPDCAASALALASAAASACLVAERHLHGGRVAPPNRRVQHADGAWRLVLEQVDGDVEVTAAQGEIDRPGSVERIDDVHVGAALDEQPDDVEVAAFGGEPQRADAVFISSVDADARNRAAPTTRARSPAAGGIEQGVGRQRLSLQRCGEQQDAMTVQNAWAESNRRSGETV